MMKRKWILFGCLIASMATQAQEAKRVLLISIDGFRPDFYMDESWKAPNLRELAAAGTKAEKAQSVFPSLTYPSHTTIVTGALPATHGIYQNVPLNSKGKLWFYSEDSIQTKTLWDVLKENNLPSAAVMWPVSVGAPITWNFPVRRPIGKEEGGQFEVTKPFITPTGLWEEFRNNIPRIQALKELDSEYEGDRVIAAMATHLMLTKKPALTAVHFLAVDHFAHAQGKNSKQVKNAVVLIDSLIGGMISDLKKAGLYENTLIIVTGDHGFLDTKYTFAPNVVLARNGLLEKARFNPSGGSAFLYLEDPNDKTTVPKIIRVFNGLSAEEKKHFRLVEKPELNRLGAHGTPALALAMASETAARGEADGEVLGTKKPNGSHGHHPETPGMFTGFLCAGPGIAKGKTIPLIGLQDISPLIAKWLNIPFSPKDGKLIPGLLN